MRMSHKQNLPRRQGVHPQAAVFPAAPGANARGRPANARRTSERARRTACRSASGAPRRCDAPLGHCCVVPSLHNATVPSRESPTRGGTHSKAARQRIRTWAPAGRGRPGQSASGRGLRVGHERQLGHRGSGAWRGAVAAPGFRGAADEGGGGAFQQGPDRCWATRCRITLLRVAPTPSGGGRQVPASQPGGLCPCWVRLMSASSTGNRAPVRPVAARRGATVMTSPRCPGSRKRTRSRLEVPGRSPNGPARITVANPSL